MTCDHCGQPIDSDWPCTPGTRTYHQHCCPQCRMYALLGPPCGSTEDQ